MTIRDMVESYTRGNEEHAESVRKDCHRYVRESAGMIACSVIVVLAFIGMMLGLGGDMGVFPQILVIVLSFGFLLTASVYCVFSTIEGMIP